MKLRDLIIKTHLAVAKKSPRDLRKLDDIATYNLGMKREKRYLTAGILIYSLSKFLSKPRFMESEENYVSQVESLLAKSKHMSDDSELGKLCEECIAIVLEWENTDKRFAKSIVQKAKLKIASVLYSQGFSLKTTSELTGCEEEDIMSYVGNTLFADRLKEGYSIANRIKDAERLLE